MQEVITDDLDVNRYVLPIRHTHLESEVTIGSGNSVVVGERFWDGSHIGYNRVNFRWGNVGTFQISPGSHMWQVMTKYYKDDPVPLTVCFGLPVAATLLAGGGFDYVVLPRGGDELGAAGAVQGFPMRLVKARTVDAYAVADCELVLEGYLHTRDKRYETREAEVFELCERIHPGLIHDVNIPFPMTDWAGCILQVKKRLKTDDGWVRNFIAAALACSAGLRICIAVDSDVDTYSMDDIIWTLTTRMNPRVDI